MIRQYSETSGLRFCKIRYGTKKPFETDWVNKPYTWEEIQDHIKKERNFGVLCGFGDLIVIDCDEKELHEHVRKDLPSSRTKVRHRLPKGVSQWYCHIWLACV